MQTSRGILNSKRRLKNNDLSVDFSDIFKKGEGKDKKEEVKMTNGSSKPVIRSTAYVDALFQEETTKLSLD